MSKKSAVAVVAAPMVVVVVASPFVLIMMNQRAAFVYDRQR